MVYLPMEGAAEIFSSLYLLFPFIFLYPTAPSVPGGEPFGEEGKKDSSDFPPDTDRNVYLPDPRKFRVLDDMLQKVRSLEPHWYYNKNNGIHALCRIDDFKRHLLLIEEEVRSGKRVPWENVVVFVKPTFTFYDGSTKPNFAHAGNYHDDMRQLKKDLVARIVGDAPLSTASPGLLQDMEEALIKYNGQLFVPYSGNKPDMKDQWEILGEKVWTLDDAKEHLFKGVSEAK